MLWTLTVELSFYAAVPIYGLIKGRVGQTVLIATASIASLVFRQYLGLNSGSFVVTMFVPYFWIFGIGMLVRLWTPSPQQVLKLFVPVLAAAYCVIVYWRGLTWFEWKDDLSVGAAVQTSVMCLLMLCIGLSSLLKSRWLAKNDASYGLYLYHMLVVTILMNISPESRSQWLILVVLAGGYLAGLLSWLLIERPGMSFVRFRRTAISPTTSGHFLNRAALGRSETPRNR